METQLASVEVTIDAIVLATTLGEDSGSHERDTLVQTEMRIVSRILRMEGMLLVKFKRRRTQAKRMLQHLLILSEKRCNNLKFSFMF